MQTATAYKNTAKATARPERPGSFKSTKKTPLQARNYVRDANGLENEERVLAAFHEAGRDVVESERSEDIRYDIDAYIDGVPVSIKTQNAGVRYGHIYVELTTQQRPFYKWEDCDHAFCDREFPTYLGELDHTWGPAWWFTGKAQRYVISQKVDGRRRIRVYTKAALTAYIKQKGFDRVMGLSGPVLRGQNGLNTVCGYMKVDEVPYVEELWI